MTCYTFNGKTYTEEDLYKKISQELMHNPDLYSLKSYIFNAQDDNLKFIESSHSKYNQPQSVDVSTFIDQEHEWVDSSGKIGLRHLSPAYDKANRISNSIKSMIDSHPGMSREEAIKEIEDQMKEEEGVSDFGTLMHKLFSVAIKSHINTGNSGTISKEFQDALQEVKETILNDKGTSERIPLLQMLTDKTAGGISIDTIMAHIVSTVQRVEQSIFAGLTPDTKVFSEYEIGTNELLGNPVTKTGEAAKNLRGIIDCLIVHPNGRVEIIDFKVSTRSFDDWYAAKKYHTEYQLGAYRSILAANGLEGRIVTLKTLPIHFPLGKVTSMSVETAKNLTAPGVSSIQKHLDWDNGEFSENLRALIRVKMSPIVANTITLKDDIQSDMEAMFGKFKIPEKKNPTKEEYISKLWAVEKNGKTLWALHDSVTGKVVYKDSREAFTKDGGFIDDMILRLRGLYSKQIELLVQDIKNYQALNSGEQKSFDLLGSSADKNIDLYNVLNGVFGKYCNTTYQLIEIPELLDYGIFIFQSNSGLFDIVRVTEEDLRIHLNICGNSTVLGKYVSNEAAKTLTSINPLDSQVANIKLMETLCACNKVSDILKSGKLGTINIVNIQKGQREVPEIRQLLSNFNYLTNKTNIENNFKSKIKTADTWEIIQECLTGIVSDLTVDDKLRQVVSDFNVGAETNKAKQDLIIRLMNKLEQAYPGNLKYTNFKQKRTFNTPQEKIYFVLSNALLYYRETPVRYDGKLTKWGLHFEEIIRILGTPFLSQYKGTLNNGYKAIGLGQGLDMGTPMSSASSNLSSLYQYWNSSFQLIRQHTLTQAEYLNKITSEFYKRHGVSNLNRAILNTNTVWEQFIVKGPDGKYTKELKIIDPNSVSNESDKLFLNQMLWEINKYLIPTITEEQKRWRYEEHASEIESLEGVIRYKDNGRYYNLPLRRATNFDRIRHIRDNGGVLSCLRKYWDSLADTYDPRQLHTSAQRVITSEFGEVTDMYNQYQISDRARASIIEQEGVYDFEVDLNLVALDVSFQNKRKELFDDCLTHANAMAVVFHYLNETSDANFDEELENLDDQTKVTLKNETIIPKELRDPAKAITAAKKLNSLMVLAVRPLQFLKELTFGQFTNYSRALALSGTKQQISASNVFRANQLVWGKTLAGWMSSFSGNEDLASFTFVQKINKLYGMANEDLNQIVKNNSTSRTGLKNGASKYMFIFNSAPDFFNRMTLFIAKMLEDGCLDAHYIDNQGLLQYDIKKDERFSELVRLGLNAKSSDQKYLKQKSLYKAMLEQFAKEGFKKPDGSNLNVNDEELYLPRAYTAKEQGSIKEIADEAYGFYDHEAKSLNDHKFIGLVFKQFMAFWTAKTRLWFKAPGSNTARGYWDYAMDGDQILYEKIYEDENGNIVKELTTENPDGTLEPATIWKGDYVEGLIYSIGYTLRDIFTGKWSDIVDNKQRLGNLKLALHDIMIGIILYNILRLIFSNGSGKMSDMNPVERTLVRAMQDTSPLQVFGLSLTPSFVSTFENLKNDIPSLFSEDRDTAEFIRRRFGALKDFTWE